MKPGEGYTTGTCAAAATAAAVQFLLGNEFPEAVEVVLPSGDVLTISVESVDVFNDSARACVIKFSGDDPDITNGMKVYSTCRFNKDGEIRITGGEGVGKVTKSGLAISPGNPAINPVPLKMIQKAATDLLKEENNGVDIEISAPEGVELARRTFNPELGIVGGISILGTTGIVKPMSEEALKASFVLKLSVLKESGEDMAILTPGNYGETFIGKNYNINRDKVVTMSNYVGYMLEKAVEHKMKKIVLIGHIGKLVKVAAGIFHTHSKVADARNEVFASHYFKFSSDSEGFNKIMESNTTEESIEFVKDKSFFNYLCNQIKLRAERRIYNDLQIEVVLFSQKHGLLGTSNNAKSMLSQLSM